MNKIHVSICNFKITVFFKCIIIIDIYLLTQDYNINKLLKDSLYRLFSRISNLNRFLWDFHDSTDKEVAYGRLLFIRRIGTYAGTAFVVHVYPPPTSIDMK